VAENFITLDTQSMTAQANEGYLTLSGETALKARRYKDLKLPEASARKLMLLQQTLMLPDAKDRGAYARLAAGMTGAYGKAKYCPPVDAGAQLKPSACRSANSKKCWPPATTRTA
jgi:peptidyl-dipeptidase A